MSLMFFYFDHTDYLMIDKLGSAHLSVRPSRRQGFRIANTDISYLSTFAQEGLEMRHKNEFFKLHKFYHEFFLQMILIVVQVPWKVPCQISRYCRKCSWPIEFHLLGHFCL